MTWLIIGGVLLFGGGIATGIGLKSDQTAKVVEQQTALIGELQDGQRQLVEAASKPIVLDAELRASLASTPVQCVAEHSVRVGDLRRVFSVGCWPLGVQSAYAQAGRGLRQACGRARR